MTNHVPLLSLTLAAAFAALTGLGCGGYVAFTQEIRDQHNLTEPELKNLQFYVSHKVTMRRQLESGGKQITGTHKLILVSGKTVEEVVVEAKTPGVVLSVDEHSLTVSFEQGSSLLFAAGTVRASPVSATDLFRKPLHRPSPPPDRLALAMLGMQFAAEPNPFPGNPDDPGHPVQETSSSEPFTGNYWLTVDSGGKIDFQGKTFDAADDSSIAHLLIKSESLEEVVENRKVLRGLRLQNQ
jgi:hypothetical protein